ncbi:Zn(II)2Cys6 transcription factor domain-containing protein [Aspergillus mulundensis]|uniref:Putative Zn(II)2Cys6 transcription factor n=1 Tax=Aspergillus mulundensis TaxID=1810919 RepID=A0A3D8SD17_9EURO|nr:putative Zn(II)2Cys6 transcription factor [Aspergillus mulundensis]RDW84203.1 putative Zn(II)2Cys6 transcription factor [Aspergillus mulundensis]
MADEDSYPAPYGRACSNCSTSKCKCIFPKSGGRCQRCQRLDKECRQPPSHKRQSARKAATSKSARLEEKLEDLVALLRAGVHSPIVNPLNNAMSTPESLDAALNSFTQNTSLPPIPTLTPDTNPSESTSRSPVAFSTPAEPTPPQADECLDTFRTQLLPYFPCIYIPPDMSVQRLRQTRPFTWLCIMSVTCKAAAQRRALNDKIKATVAQQMVHNSASTDIDILLGLLIYLGWSNQQVYNKANLHVFTQLVHAAVYELGIHNPSAKPKMMALCVYTEEEEDAPVPGQSMEERRAVLAAFLVTSMYFSSSSASELLLIAIYRISTFVQKTDSLRWTPFMAECLRQVEERQECINDEILVQQVRLQQITDKLNMSTGFNPTSDSVQVPPAFYLRSMQTQLQNIQPRVALDAQAHKILLLHHHYASLTLHESALTSAPMSPSSTLNFQQLEHHYACLSAAKSWFALFLSIPPASYISFPFSIFAQMVHNLVVLYQLSTFDNPSWDVAAVRKTIDVLELLETVIKNMGLVAAAAGLEGEADSDVFSVVAKMYKSVLVGWEVNLAPPMPMPMPMFDGEYGFTPEFGTGAG